MRYIDADALIKKIFPYDVVDKKYYTINAKAVADAIDNAPTADVVPKSEVERLEKEKAELLVSKETDVHISMEKLVKVRTEHPIFNAIEEKVAREIFEEIESLFLKDNFRLICNRIDFAELKKKYTDKGE